MVININNLPSVVLNIILYNLDIPSLVSLSETNTFFNQKCKKIKKSFFTKSLEFNNDILTPELFPEIHLPILNENNYMVCSSAWKEIKFFMKLNLDSRDHKFILMKKTPGNILFSLKGITSASTYLLNSSVKMLDSSFKTIYGPCYLSHNLEYLNVSENYFIPSNIDFSGKSLKFLNMSMCYLSNRTFNFSKKLKTVIMFGATGITNLKGFEHVETLIIDYCYGITSLEPLKNVKNLSMRGCVGIDNASPLVNCIKLDISNTNIWDLSMLKKLKKITASGIKKLCLNTEKLDIITLKH